MEGKWNRFPRASWREGSGTDPIFQTNFFSNFNWPIWNVSHLNLVVWPRSPRVPHSSVVRASNRHWKVMGSAPVGRTRNFFSECSTWERYFILLNPCFVKIPFPVVVFKCLKSHFPVQKEGEDPAPILPFSTLLRVAILRNSFLLF